ncbi:hypothetical protein [Bordetella genomosp. 7]|nr:hypothetical protein [Bordetella genomosp. 7]
MELPIKRKPGRPRKPGGPFKRLSISMPTDVKGGLDYAAALTGMGTSDLVTACVRIGLRQAILDAMQTKIESLGARGSPLTAADILRVYGLPEDLFG